MFRRVSLIIVLLVIVAVGYADSLDALPFALGKTTTANPGSVLGKVYLDARDDDAQYQLVKAAEAITVGTSVRQVLAWSDQSAYTVVLASANDLNVMGVIDPNLDDATALTTNTYFYAKVSGFASVPFDDNGSDLSTSDNGALLFASAASGSAGLISDVDFPTISGNTASISTATVGTQASNTTSTNAGLQTTLNALVAKFNSVNDLVQELKTDVNTNATTLGEVKTDYNTAAGYANNHVEQSIIGEVDLASGTTATASGSAVYVKLKVRR